MVIITCPNCGAKNRVDEAKAQATPFGSEPEAQPQGRRQPVCGRCKTKLIVPVGAGAAMGDGKPVTVTDATISNVLRDAGDRPVLVDAWAAWCGPCRMIAPTIDQLAAESNGRWVVAKLDVDSNPMTATQYRIDSIPALLLFKNGKLVDKMVGLQPKQAIASRLASV